MVLLPNVSGLPASIVSLTLVLATFGFALAVWGALPAGRSRRVLTTFAFALAAVVALAQLPAAPQVLSDICRFDPWALECWFR